MNSRTTQSSEDTADDRLDKLVEKFEREFDLNLEKVTVTPNGFDGRIGDPALAMKRNMTRFFKHYLKDYAASYLAEQEAATLKRVYDFVEWESGKSGRKEILAFIEAELTRLKTGRNNTN